MFLNSKKIKTASEIIKNVAEVFALIIAGLWAYTQFHDIESPSLEPRSFSESKLVWFNVSNSSHCGGEFQMSIKNIGKKSFDLKTATLSVWLIDPPPLNQTQTISYIDAKDFQFTKPAFERQFSETSQLALLTHFSPGTEANFDFTFMFDLHKGNKKIALFGFTANGTELEVNHSRWDYLCHT